MIVPKGIRDELRWFYEARFGMFVHFGLYSLLGRGEWAMYHEEIPRGTYSRLMDDFNPHLFDADAWVQLARDAGARYITATAKHHDGFCLFDSALTDFKITNTPFKRDLIGELVRACQKHGMRIILYYSQPDWHHPNYVHCPGAFKDLTHPPETDRPDWPAYQRYYIGQVEELCRNYGSIDGIWFDGSHKSVDAWQGKAVYALIKRYQPHAVVNDRARYGDFFTPERTLPEDLTGYLFESCESVSPVAWGYRRNSPSYTTPHLVRSLVKMAAAGGNYLLNVGPQPDGRIPDRQAQVMREIGAWLRVNGQAVYQTDPVRLPAPRIRKRTAGASATEPFVALAGRTGVTRGGNTIYFHCLEWPEIDRFIIPGIQSAVRQVRLLGSDQVIRFEQSDLGVELFDLPATPPNAQVQVFALLCDLAPGVTEDASVGQEAEPAVIELNARGSTTLPAHLAIQDGRAVKGSRLVVEQDNERQTTVLSGWMVPEQEAHWILMCPEDGDWQVSVYGSCPVSSEEAVVRITVQGQALSAALPDPQAAQNAGSPYPKVIAGTVRLAAGRAVLTLHPEKLVWGYVLGKIEKVQLDRA
ncbi:MAG: alpha-L-fucosidase [Clostridiaceae bacterium]|jgi:alpha-L-fucosidase|nr:alpha-L-fucosidase [Clostridiaceae bacterium]